MWMDNWVLNIPPPLWPSPDLVVESGQRMIFRFFESQRPLVVLSSSNEAGRESFQEVCTVEGVPIVRRKGGGGTVVLGPGCLILTFAFPARDLFGNSRYFRTINDLWGEALDSCGVAGVQTRGISDLAVGDRKIAGTSIFRRKHLLVYQGSLLVDPDFAQIERLLAHPSREPDYRAGRRHREFLASLRELGCPLSTGDVGRRCEAYFSRHAWARLAPDCLDVTTWTRSRGLP